MSGGIFDFASGNLNNYGAAAAGMASQASSDAREARTDTRLLQDRIDHLTLVCMAMWSIIQDKTDATEQDLLDRVKTIDLMDGKEDGKADRGIQKCPKCGRVMSPRHRKCIYCGSERLGQSAFDSI